MLSDLLTSLGSVPLPVVLGVGVGTTVAAMGALVGVSSWIDGATEGPDGPLTERDYTTCETLPVLCSYGDGKPSAGTVADFELCEEHLGDLLPRSATPMWV